MKDMKTSLPQTPCHSHCGYLNGDTCINDRLGEKNRVKDTQEESPGTESSSVPEAVVASSHLQGL